MQSEIKISVIVPVYKVEKYLPDCLDSLLAQSFNELEIILIDDGSPDKCGEICDAYAQKDSRIKVIHKSNAGVSNARNMGIELAQGKYISFIDSDDFIHPLFYQTLYENLLNFQADTSAICLQEVEENAKTPKYVNPQVSKKFKMDGLGALDCIQDFSRPWVGYPFNKLYSLDIIRKNNLCFDENFILCEDFLFNCQYLLFSKTLVLDENKFYFYRIRPYSAVRNTMQSEKPLRSKMQVFDKVLDIANNYPNSTFQKRICKSYHLTCISYLIMLSKLGINNKSEIKNIRKKIKKADAISFAELPFKLKIFRVLLKMPAFIFLFFLKLFYES